MSVMLTLGRGGVRPRRVTWSRGRPEIATTPEESEPAGGILTPGFVDLHIHGAFGIDFMEASGGDMARLCDGLADEGYEAFLPTTVSATLEGVAAALAQLQAHPMIRGFHLEGPFLSPEYPGAQPLEAIIAPPVGHSSWDAIVDDPRLRVVTLAPERSGGLALIARLARRGVHVSMGHSNATVAQARAGALAGARGVTHTFNAMRQFHHRDPGLVGVALTDRDLVTELIYDRVHVAKEAAGALLACKGKRAIVAVSDGTKASGLAEKTKLSMWGHDCVVGKGDVRLVSSGALAGSAITLRNAFRILAEDFGLDAAIRACCVNPRRVLGIRGEPALWLEFGLDYSLRKIHRA
ncbi:MAG: amidohydrolase family protein [Fimbriimonas ginsengisoli]|uniref:Amidohydrolase family protein n=1 Tax=Fimbriimonas ginsengisoli TaxID=1005039 RepID=A0A931LRX3_FIMGI|nr:amidohydrolase family protein [Fimbriimonas ginsengisoli]